MRSTLVPKSVPSTTPSVSLFLSFYLSCVRTQALPICLTGALLNFIIPKTSGTNCKRRRRNRRKRGQPTTKVMIMGTQGERPPAVAWFMERGRRRRRPGVSLSLSLSLREDPASSFGAPAKTEKENSRERFVLCCVVGLPKLVFILILILPLRLPSPARPQGTSRNEALPPFFWQTPLASVPFPPSLPSPAIFFQNISRSKFPGREPGGGQAGGRGRGESLQRERRGCSGGGRLGARQWRRAGQGRGTR